MTKKELIARWENPDFQAKVAYAIEKILTKSELRDIDLRGITIGNEGPVRDLWNANLAGCNLSHIDFSYSRFEGSFKKALIQNVNFSDAAFERCGMHSARFEDSSFERARIKTTSMDDSHFLGCDFSSANLQGKGMALGYGARRGTFIGCNFKDVKFVRLEFRACLFERCRFEGALLDKCVIAGVKFVGQVPSMNQFKSCEVQRTFSDGKELVVD